MRYPTRNGLALPITELGFEVVEFQKRKTNQHHIYFDRAWYQDKRYRQVFRGLLPHVQTMRLDDHDELHDRYSGPVVPKDSLMIDVIDEYLALNGVIDCVYERRTCASYQIESGTWQNIKSQYRSGHGVQETYESANGFAYSRP